MSGLIFDERTMLDGNIFKFEQRLQSQANKYIENGMILTTYFSQRENSITVDRGTRDIEQLFGNHSPLRFNQINHLPMCGFGQHNPDNTDELQVEDINLEGDATILPSTIVPKQLDFFLVDHLKMRAIFQVTSVTYDSMKVEGYYKIHYRLYSTSEETIFNLQKQTMECYETDLNAIGTNLNPIIVEDDFNLRIKIQQMVNYMIQTYCALFYNKRHNCFLFHHPEMGLDWFDLCGNEFMAKHSIMNASNSNQVIILHEKIRDIQMPLFYNNSIYNWLELGAPARLLQKFYFILNTAEGYPLSSFVRWGDDQIQIMQPLVIHQIGIYYQNYSFFSEEQFQSFLDPKQEPTGSEYEKLLWKFIHKQDTLSIHDVSLYLADMLISSVKHIEVFIYTPIIIYIIRKILRMH